MCGGLVGGIAPGALPTLNNCNYEINIIHNSYINVHRNVLAKHIDILFYDQNLHLQSVTRTDYNYLLLTNCLPEAHVELVLVLPGGLV